MKRVLAALPLAALLAVGDAAASEAVPPVQPPSKPESGARTQTRTERPHIFGKLSLLFRLQDAAAAGQADSIAAQKQVLTNLGAELQSFFQSASPEQLRLIAPDVAAYVLSGGDPACAVRLAKASPLDLRTRRILEMSAVFMQGDREAAARQLKDIETQGLPMRLKGRLALVQALLDDHDMVSKQKHLATAIAAMPGTLIEESALRRSALAFADAHDERLFWERVARYQRRFPNSLYAPAFWQDVSHAVIAWPAKESGFDLERLNMTWRDLEPAQRRSLYLGLTRQAAAANNRRVMEFAAAKLRGLSPEGGTEDQAAKLYLSLYEIASAEGDDALRALKSLRLDLLGPQERQLLNAALAVSEQINRPLPAAWSAPGVEEAQEDALQIRGQKALDDSGKILAGLSP